MIKELPNVVEYYKNFSIENIVEEKGGIVHTEQWKDIAGFDGLYQVSDFGRVKSLARITTDKYGDKYVRKHDKIHRVFPSRGRDGYLRTLLYKNGVHTSYSVHRLVAKMFIDNPNKKPCVNHKDGRRNHNVPSNLEWVTYSENNQHAYDFLNHLGALKGKFGKDHHTSKKIIQKDLSGNFIRLWDSIMDVQRAGVGWSAAIILCCKGRKDNYKNSKWEYES